MGQPGLFDLEQRYQRLSETGDPLVKLASLIDFEVFRTPLTAALRRSDGSKGGCPAYDPLLMFELLPGWWTPPLSHRGDPLEFHRADIANGRVAPGRVVEPFDIIEHVGPSMVSRSINLAGNPLGFER